MVNKYPIQLSRRALFRIFFLLGALLVIALILYVHFDGLAGGVPDRIAALASLGVWAQFIVLVIAAIIAYRQWRNSGDVSRKRVTYQFIVKLQTDKELLEAMAVKRVVVAEARRFASAEGKGAAWWLSTLFAENSEGSDRFAMCLHRVLNLNSHDEDGGGSAQDSKSKEKNKDSNVCAPQVGNGASLKSPKNSIQTLLNIYEIMSIGVYKAALDRDMVVSWWKTAIVNDYFVFHKAIEVARAHYGNTRLFENFEKLALELYDLIPAQERPKK